MVSPYTYGHKSKVGFHTVQQSFFKSLVMFFLLSKKTGLHFSIQTSYTPSSLHLHHPQLPVIEKTEATRRDLACSHHYIYLLPHTCAYIHCLLFMVGTSQLLQRSNFFFLFFSSSFSFWIPSPPTSLTTPYHLCYLLLVC